MTDFYRPNDKKLEVLNRNRTVKIEIRDGANGWRYSLRFVDPKTGNTTHRSLRKVRDIDVVK